jgi:hypothetical protein
VMTLRKVERGEPSVAIGIVFEVAVLLGIDLLGTPDEVHARTGRVQESLALLPQRVRHPRGTRRARSFHSESASRRCRAAASARSLAGSLQASRRARARVPRTAEPSRRVAAALHVATSAHAAHRRRIGPIVARGAN